MNPKEEICSQCKGNSLNQKNCVYCNGHGVVLRYPNGIATQYPPKERIVHDRN